MLRALKGLKVQVHKGLLALKELQVQLALKGQVHKETRAPKEHKEQ